MIAATLHSPKNLFSQSQLADDRTVALNIRFLQIVKQISSVTDHFLETATAVEVLFVVLQMCRQIGDPSRQNGNLHFGRTGVTFMGGIGFNEVQFFFFLHG